MSTTDDLLDAIADAIAARVIARLDARPQPAPPAPPPPAEYVTTRQAAKILALSTGTLEGWRARGAGPKWIRLGTAIRYSRAELDAWLAAHAQKKPSK
jgi:excisionase family DNA binding protein